VYVDVIVPSSRMENFDSTEGGLQISLRKFPVLENTARAKDTQSVPVCGIRPISVITKNSELLQVIPSLGYSRSRAFVGPESPCTHAGRERFKGSIRM
jgi:hypothetical protein